jgi:hypothetical protein
MKYKIVKRAALVSLIKGMRKELRIFVGKSEIMTQLGISQHTWVMRSYSFIYGGLCWLEPALKSVKLLWTLMNI